MEELRVEEQTGFEPAEDQETFLLERQPYPGLLPEEFLREAALSQRHEMSPALSEASDEPIAAEESLRLEDDLRRLVQEELQRAAVHRRRGWKRTGVVPETPSRQLGEEAVGAEIEVNVSRDFPRHPSQVVGREESVSPPVTQPPQLEVPPTGEVPRRRELPFVELILLAVVFGGGALLWYALSRHGQQQNSGGSPGGDGKARGAEVRAPLRSVREVEPLVLEPQSPLLQLVTTTPPNTTTKPKKQEAPTQTLASAQPTPHLSNSPYRTALPLPTATPARSPSLFTIQVYASRSYADAIELAEHLRRQRLPNVTVSSAIIRGETWWRVRFGNYPNRLQAEHEALRAGFINAWIVPLQ